MPSLALVTNLPLFWPLLFHGLPSHRTRHITTDRYKDESRRILHSLFFLLFSCVSSSSQSHTLTPHRRLFPTRNTAHTPISFISHSEHASVSRLLFFAPSSHSSPHPSRRPDTRLFSRQPCPLRSRRLTTLVASSADSAIGSPAVHTLLSHRYLKSGALTSTPRPRAPLSVREGRVRPTRSTQMRWPDLC